MSKDGGEMPSGHYVGKAGQLAVMAELAWRGYNVAIPEIDIGDDIFARDDRSGSLSRVQVKTATGKKLKRREGAYRCQFSIPESHVSSASSGTHYVLVGRCGGNWRYLVFKRYILSRLLTNGTLGTKMGEKSFMITMVFFGRRDAKVSTKKDSLDLSRHAGRWEIWKRLPGGAAETSN